ncbi:MAG: RlmE family RNA methyltransferase [Clostridia bacterium]
MAKSSKQWLRRHVTDPYVRRAQAEGFRSRAAYKLMEIDDKERLLRPGTAVLDLGAAPGGWSQVAAKRVMPGGRVAAVDLLKVEPIPGVHVVQGDFRDAAVRAALGDGKVDVVVSDLSPNLSGIPGVDQARSLELAEAALDVCRSSLKPDGAFVTKAFQGEAFHSLKKRLEAAFETVKVVKPAASRGESRETYFVCRRCRLSPA